MCTLKLYDLFIVAQVEPHALQLKIHTMRSTTYVYAQSLSANKASPVNTVLSVPRLVSKPPDRLLERLHPLLQLLTIGS